MKKKLNCWIIIIVKFQTFFFIGNKRFRGTYNDKPKRLVSKVCSKYTYYVGQTYKVLRILKKYSMCEQYAGYVTTVLMIDFGTYF